MEYINLLDCNRLESIEYRAGNENMNAMWSNEFKAGIQVNVGDKISVHQGYISEAGSESNSIQMVNKFLQTKPITYTKITQINPVQDDNQKLLGYERSSASNITENVDYYTNETTLLYNYYITTHGENTVSLPRRFSYEGILIDQDWNSFDKITNGRSLENPFLFTSINASLNGSRMNQFGVDDDYFYFTGHVASASHIVDGFRIRNDNSRFMIFTQTETRYGTQTDSASIPDIVSASLTSPSQLEYIEYIEKLKINIPTGFKSPDTISNVINNQLQKQEQPQQNRLSSEATYTTGITMETLRPVSLEVNSPTYHTFYSQGNLTNNFDTYNVWDTSTADNRQALEYLSSYQYIGIKRPNLYINGRNWLKTYREFLIDTVPGGSFPNDSFAVNSLLYDLPKADFRKDAPKNASRNHTVILEILWNDKARDGELLQKHLADALKEQGNHNELFSNKYNQYKGFTTKNNSRFLHLNAMNNTRRGVAVNASIVGKQLGCDYIQANCSGIPYLHSVPLFFDFNPDYEDTYTEGESWEKGYSYGLFKKYIDTNGLEYISVTTEHLGIIEDPNLTDAHTTIPACYFTINDANPATSTIDKETKFGWDCHFNSYGNVVVGLIDGWTKSESDGLIVQNKMYPTAYNNSELGTYFYAQKIYLGADNPQISYNTISNKFEIKNLHTSERIQNRFNAGGVAGTGENETLTATFPSAGEEVWKINKRLYNNSFTPSMRPFAANNINPLTVDGIKYNVDFLNPNLEGWKIYDQLSGIIIKDFGYKSNVWNEGIFGRLGFTYEQFNSLRTSENDLTTRVGNNNKDALPYAFTNANVKQEATLDFNTNIFGAGKYNLQIPITTSWNASNHGANANASFRNTLAYQTFPEINEAATSVALTAPNLPSKLVNPYYTIRTDVLDNNQYYGGKNSFQPLPIIATIAKSSDYNNFFVSLDGGLEFTFTKPKMITNIKTSITDPDGSLADISGNSAIIYKITKYLPKALDVLEDLLEEKPTRLR